MKNIKIELKDLVYRDQEVLNGTPCFVGTRVPVATILEYISLGWSINDLKKSYPTVKSDYIVKLIKVISNEFTIHAKTI